MKTKTKRKNIWKNIDFTEKKEKSAYDFLLEQSDSLTVATTGVLKMQIDAVDSYFDEEPPRLAALYILYVVAPILGNFRRKILTVAEYSESGRFPVDIVSHIDNSQPIRGISIDKFIETIEEILSRPSVKKSIENLYIQSKEYKKNITSFPQQQAGL